MQICKKMQKCKKLKSTQKCKLKNKIGHQLLVQKSELGRGFRDFRPCFHINYFYPKFNEENGKNWVWKHINSLI